MKQSNVNSILLVGSDINNKPSILFQCAVHWAEQGYKVLYISNTLFNELPPAVHGTSSITSLTDVFSKIRFMSLPRWQDLLQHLYSLHQYGNIPQVIIVQELSNYCYPSIVESEQYDGEMHAALVCASLFDAASVCANYTNQQALLIASIKKIPHSKLETIANNFFSDLVWISEIAENDDKFSQSVRITKLDTNPGQASSKELEFTSKADGFIMLKNIFSTFSNRHT